MKNNQKILYIDGYFKLPYDFEGNNIEALDELLTYLKSNTSNTKNKLVLDQDFNKDILWDMFLNMINDSENSFCGEIELSKFNEKEDKMEIL